MPDILDDDIGADVLAAMTEVGGGDPAPGPGQAQPFTPEGPVEGAHVEADGPGMRSRDEHGRFAPKAKTDADGAQDGAQAQPLEKAGERAQDGSQPKTGAEPAQSAIHPPASLRATVKAKWSTLDPEVQQELARMDRTVVDSRTEWASKGERLNRFDEMLGPVREQLALRGTDEFRFLQGLIMADGMLRGPSPEQALADIAAIYGLRPPPQAQPGQDGRPQHADPTVQTLQREVADLKGQLQQRAQTEEQASQREVLGQVEAFRTETNPDGSLKNLYFDNVRELMGSLLDSGRARSLPEAYEMAIHADPDVRKLVLSVQPRAEQRDLAAKGLSITGAPTQGGKSAPVASNGAIEDDVWAAYREVQGAL